MFDHSSYQRLGYFLIVLSTKITAFMRTPSLWRATTAPPILENKERTFMQNVIWKCTSCLFSFQSNEKEVEKMCKMWHEESNDFNSYLLHHRHDTSFHEKEKKIWISSNSIERMQLQGEARANWRGMHFPCGCKSWVTKVQIWWKFVLTHCFFIF